MADQWLTYEEAGELFDLSAEAMRKRARRLGWRIQVGNDNQTKTRVLVPEGVALRPAGPPPGRPAGDRPDDQSDGLVAELRQRAESAEASEQRERAGRERAEDERDHLAAEIIQEREQRARTEGELRERAARAEGELAGVRVAFQQEQGRAQRAESEAAGYRDAAVQAGSQAAAERAARQAAEAARDIAAATAETVRGELASWTAGGPLARAWRAFLSRRGRP